MQNQPGPHVEAALAALQRAFKREWSPGEPRLMADFLAGLGGIAQPALAKEQLRQLEVLHREAKPAPFDRLHIAHRFAETLDSYTRTDEAIDLLQAALKEFQEANDGVLPVSANNAAGDADHLPGSARATSHAARSCCSPSSSTRFTQQQASG